MSIRKFQASLALTLLLLTVTSPLSGKDKKASERKPASTKNSTPAPPPEPVLPASLQISNGETIPFSELVPRTEAAILQLGQIASGIRPPEVMQAANSLGVLSQTVSSSAEATLNSIRAAHSPLQLPETKVTWSRYRSELQSIGSVIAKHASNLENQQKQVTSIRTSWEAILKAVTDAKLPYEYIQRVATVEGMANQAQLALVEERQRLIKEQVRLSDTSTRVDDVIDQATVAEAALREQLFVIDSPPLWSSLHASDFRGTGQQVATILAGIRSRTGNFYQSYRAKLFFYLIFNVVVLIVIVRYSRRDPAVWKLQSPAQEEIFRHPVALSLFVMLSLFSPFFATAPPEVLRFFRMLLVVPMVLLATPILDRQVRNYVIGLGAIYFVNALSLQLLSGTVVRRLLSLLMSAVIVGALAMLLRQGGLVRRMLAEHGWPSVLRALQLGVLLLLISIIANVIGNSSLADVLTNGTVFSLYYSVGGYTFFLAFTALSAAMTGSAWAQKSRAIRLHREVVLKRISLWIGVIAWFIWVFATMVAFQIWNQASSETRDILRHKWHVGAVSLSLLDIVLFFVVLYISNLVAKMIRFFLNEEILPRTDMNPGAAQAGSRLTYIALLTIGFFLSLGAAGLELSKITVLTGAFGVGLGFGLQNVVNNFVCGIIVSLERPVQVGDIVEVGTLMGEVRTIGFRSSTVRTFDGADVIVPNSELITKPVVNWSLTDFYRRTDMIIGVAYGTDPKRVLAILMNIISSHPGVLKRPEPLITFDQFADSSLNFTVRFWSKLDDRLRVRSDLNIQIAEEFEKNGIQIPFPQRDVHLFVDPSAEVALPASLKARSAQASASE